MDSTRELDHVRSDIEKLQERAIATATQIASIESTNNERFDNLAKILNELKTDIDETRDAIKNLESLATEGKSSLRTLLWTGGVIASLTSFVLLIYSYVR